MPAPITTTRPTEKYPATRELKQSNSESMIYERKMPNKKLDPRIYPSWWGEDNLESAPRRNGSKPA